MKKVIICFLIFLIAVSGILYWRFFVTMRYLPEGEMVASSVCETCNTKINAYLVNGGATVDYCIRCEKITPEGKKENIYWAYHEQEADIEWIDCDNVSINGKTLNIKNA